MNPRLRSLLAALAASGVAVYAGWQIAEGSYALVTLLAGLLAVIALEWSGVLRPEAALGIFLIGGYVLGNRGFAQITPAGGLPLPIGEVGLAAMAALVIARGAVQRRLPVQSDALNRCLLLWFALGAGRIAWDVKTFGLYALRDFAMVYYCLFFFLLQAIAADADFRRRCHTSLVFIFGALPFMAVLVELLPSFFLTQLTLNGVPVFYYKGDLLATFLCSGFFLLVPASDHAAGWSRGWRTALAMFSLGLGIYFLSRAAIAGLAVGLLGCALARRWTAVRTAALTFVLGGCLATGAALFTHVDFKQSKVYAVYEHLVSIADFSGTRSYENTESADSGGNNQYRTTWWRATIRETLDDGPVFGLGFGYDLAAGFVRDYYPTLDDEFTVRSPHSIVVTVFGRMGAAGTAVWLLFMALLFRESWRARRLPPAGRQDDAIIYLVTCWVILVSACFGVVLEGPMGAIVFWSLLGLAHAIFTQQSVRHEQGAAEAAATAP